MPLPRLPTPFHVMGIVLVFMTVTFIVYGSSLRNEFVSWDDTLLIRDNPIVQTMNGRTVWQAFTSYDPELYIPLTFVSYQLSHLLGGNDSTIYHVTDLLLHTANAILVSWLLYLLIANGWLALTLGLIFAVHPLNTEAVVWASARKDVLSTCFFLSSLIAYILYTENASPRTYRMSLLMFTLALLAKIMAVTLPVVLLLLDILRGRRLSKTVMVEKIPYVLLSILFGVIGLFGKSKVLVSSTLLQKVLMAAKSMMFYLQKFFWPADLSVVYPYTKAITLSSFDFAVPALCCLLFAFAVIALWKRKKSLSLALLFVVVTVLPTFLNFAKGGDIYVASDRYFYVPMIGMLLFFGLLLSAWLDASIRVADRRSRLNSLVLCSVCVITLLSVLSMKQSKVWANSITLYEHALSLYPNSRAASNNLGMERLASEDTDEAIRLFKESIALHPTPETSINLAAAYVQKADYASAEPIFLTVLSEFPSSTDALYGLGNVRQKQGKLQESVEWYRKAITQDPNYINAYNNLSAAYLQMKDWTNAKLILQKLIEMKPTFVEAYYNLALTEEKLGQPEQAEILYRKILVLSPGDADALSNLASLLYDRGDIVSAADYLKRALAINSENDTGLHLLFRMKHDGIVR